MSKVKLYILPLIFILVSCDLLQTRDPEDPDVSRNSFKTALTPEILFENLVNSFSQKNNEGYKSCFVENTFLEVVFNFIPSSASSVADPALLEWTLEKEYQYFFNLIQGDENNSVKLTLTNGEWNSIGEKRIYRYDYSISVSHLSNQTFYSGTSQFEIQQDQRNHWVIVNWIDIRTQNSLTWSDLKGVYY